MKRLIFAINVNDIEVEYDKDSIGDGQWLHTITFNHKQSGESIGSIDYYVKSTGNTVKIYVDHITTEEEYRSTRLILFMIEYFKKELLSKYKRRIEIHDLDDPEMKDKDGYTHIKLLDHMHRYFNNLPDEEKSRFELKISQLTPQYVVNHMEDEFLQHFKIVQFDSVLMIRVQFPKDQVQEYVGMKVLNRFINDNEFHKYAINLITNTFFPNTGGDHFKNALRNFTNQNLDDDYVAKLRKRFEYSSQFNFNFQVVNNPDNIEIVYTIDVPQEVQLTKEGSKLKRLKYATTPRDYDFKTYQSKDREFDVFVIEVFKKSNYESAGEVVFQVRVDNENEKTDIYVSKIKNKTNDPLLPKFMITKVERAIEDKYPAPFHLHVDDIYNAGILKLLEDTKFKIDVSDSWRGKFEDGQGKPIVHPVDSTSINESSFTKYLFVGGMHEILSRNRTSRREGNMFIGIVTVSKDEIIKHVAAIGPWGQGNKKLKGLKPSDKVLQNYVINVFKKGIVKEKYMMETVFFQDIGFAINSHKATVSVQDLGDELQIEYKVNPKEARLEL